MKNKIIINSFDGNLISIPIEKAETIEYDNINSHLPADNVQDAIDQLKIICQQEYKYVGGYFA